MFIVRWRMGVEGRRDETKLVMGLYRLEVGVMGLRSLKVLLLGRNARLVNKRVEGSKERKRDNL
jgi:hypothetical protein